MDAKHVWRAALERVRRRISPSAFATWFSGTTAVELSQGHMVVAAPTTFASMHLHDRFHELARVAVSEVIGQSTDLRFIAQAQLADQPPAHISPAPARPNAAHAPTARTVAAPPRQARPSTPRTPAPRVPATRAATTSARTRPTPAVAQHTALASTPRQAPPAFTRTGGGMGARRSRPRPAQPPLVDYMAAPERETPEHWSAPAAVVSHEPVEASGAYDELNPRYVFESYIVGTANRLGYAAALEVADTPGEQYNPLLIYGGVGLGKTHLLHAIGHRTRAAGLSVAYVTAERFTNEIIEAIRLRTTEAFRLRYRQVDVLLVDDVQFIAGKESTEEEFFHTFNALHDANKQIVLSSDRVPHAMHHLHDRLRSRFEWGLIADIQAPDFEHRLAILRAKATAIHMTIPEEVLVRLARPECESIRALEGALNRVVAHAQMLRRPLDMRLVEEALAPLAGTRGTRPVESEEVLSAVATHFHLGVADLRGKSRERAIAWARQVAMYLLREETPASLLQIGNQLGGRDHTTIMHGCAHVGKALAHDERARDDLAAIRAALHGA